MSKKAVVERYQGQVAMDNIVNIYGVAGPVTMSFETSSQGAVKVRFPFAANITALRGQVTKAVAASNAGTVTPSNSSGNITGGTLTFAASAAVGNEQTATTLTTNKTIAKDTDLTLTPAKSTAGGVVQVTVQYQRIAN